MNKLSWLFYIGDLSSNLSNLACLLSFVCFLLALGVFVAWCCQQDGATEYIKYNHESNRENFKKFLKFPTFKFSVCLFLMAFLGILGCFLPSQATVYAIAASEMGEQAIKTPLATKAEKALEFWLDQQIKRAQQDGNTEKPQ
jgi:hypothetical protein